MSFKNICARETYQDKDGNEKVNWNQIGVVIDKGDKMYIKLHHLPGQLFHVFENKKDQQSPESAW